MRRFVYLFALLVVFALTITLQAQANSAPRDRIETIKNYVVYYGEGRVEELARFDLAIIQPETLTAAELTRLKEQGTLVVAYLSIGEVELDRVWYQDGRVDPAWELGLNENWGSRFIDARQSGWQDLMIELTGEYVAKGFDGVFLDTVDTADLFPETYDGMVTLIRRLREAYPDVLLVQNRGFSVMEDTASDIDALMFEDLVTTYDFDTNEYLYTGITDETQAIAEQLVELRDETGLVILALDYVDLDHAADASRAVEAAKAYGFVPSVATIYLDDILEFPQ